MPGLEIELYDFSRNETFSSSSFHSLSDKKAIGRMPFTVMFPGCMLIRKNIIGKWLTDNGCWIQQDLRTFRLVLSIFFGTAFFVLQTCAAGTFLVRFSHAFIVDRAKGTDQTPPPWGYWVTDY